VERKRQVWQRKRGIPARGTVASVTNNNFGYTDAQSLQNVQRKLKKIVTNWYFHSQNYDYSNHSIANSEKKA
jgi:hypothetical protein